MWFSIVFPTVLAALKASFKNPQKAAEVRQYALQLATWIQLTWGDDPTFAQQVNVSVESAKRKM